MKGWLKWTLIVVAILLLAVVAYVVKMTRDEGIGLVRNPLEEREPIVETPADYGLDYQDVTVTTADGLQLVGWYLPSSNGAAVIAQHGYKGMGRQDLLVEAEFLNRHGYGVLVTSVRAHDECEGDLITLGKYEMMDFEAWYQFLLNRPDVDPDKIGIIGESMGGALSLKYASQNPEIKAVVSHSAFASFDDTVNIAVELKTGLPAFPFAPMIIYWAEKEADITVSEIDATEWVAEISPRPVFIMSGGADDHIDIQSGHWLYEAAGEPKEFWYEEGAVHHGFDEEPFRDEFETRVVAFFDKALLEE